MQNMRPAVGGSAWQIDSGASRKASPSALPVDEDVLPLGVAAFTAVALRLLGAS